jgi:hypothetical protein
MKEQKDLLYLTKIEAEDMKCPALRAVRAQWREKDSTACISFYFNGPIAEEDLEKGSDACGQIISSFPGGHLEENYIRVDYPQPLSDQGFFAYKSPQEYAFMEKKTDIKDLQKHLISLTKIKFNKLHSDNLRGVRVVWEEYTSFFSLYFCQEPTEDEVEEIATLCAEIVTEMPREGLKKQYIIWEHPKPLPPEHLAYTREE